MVIVGAGQGGLQLAESLRTEGWTGPIRLIGEESYAPYHRPPLSKALLAGDSGPDHLIIRGPEFFARKGIEVITGTRVTAIDRAAREVVLADGRREPYAGLALATGSRARTLPLPGADLDGIVVLRTLDDALDLKRRLAGAGSVAVVGGGFIGLEVAASARKLGHTVTIIEAVPRLMARAVSEAVSTWYADLHTRHGVRILLSTGVTGFTGADGRVTAVETSAGPVAADLVVVGVGVIPDDELARASGLDCDRGVVVDDCSRTSDPAIVALGDCTARRLPDGSLIRLESVQNAVEQAKSGAAWLTGKERIFTAAPWFWSDQYDVKLQMVGLSAGHDRTVTLGSAEEGRFSILYWRADRFVAVDSIDRPSDHMAARRLLDRKAPLTPEEAAAPGFDLAAYARTL
jgi:3-phenylpropionate/trans-cinnamate dioxygenase ferredoxin reductase subunit